MEVLLEWMRTVSPIKHGTPPSTPRHFSCVPISLIKPPSPPRFLPWDKKAVGGVGFQVFIVGVFLAVGQGRRGRLSQERSRGARRDQRTRRRKTAGMSLLSYLQFPRHLTEGAGQTKGEGRPVVPDGALEGGRERSGAPLGVPGGHSPAPCPCGPRRRAPGCGSARACRCVKSAGLRAGRACSSTRRSRRRCDRRGTAGRKCRTDLGGEGREAQARGRGRLRPHPPRGSWLAEGRGWQRRVWPDLVRVPGGRPRWRK